MKRVTYKYAAEEIGVHIDTLFKARRKGRCSTDLAIKLQDRFGIDLRKWIKPKKYGDFWKELRALPRHDPSPEEDRRKPGERRRSTRRQTNRR